MLEPEICTAFIKRIYEDEKKWFSYNMLDTLAHINGLHVKIKRLSAKGTFDTVHEFRGGSVEKILLHTVAGIEGGYHLRAGELEETLNHFNLLSMHRGILVSPTITYSHVHNVMKSKSTSIGAQVSPKSAIPGSASFGHDKKNKQSDTLATISSNIYQVTNSDTSGINQDVEKMTREGKNTGTHVNIHAPAVSLGNVGELWNQAKANAGIVANKVLGTPVETFAPPQIVRKEEPEDTSITDAEADAIMDDLEVQGKKQEAERKAQERRAAEKAAAEKKEAAESIFNAPIKTETDWTVSILDSESRGRPQERIVTRVNNPTEGEVSPTTLDNTYIEKGSAAFNGGIEECFESREKFYQGDNSLKTVAQALVAQNLDNLAQLPQFADKLTFGLFSKAGELFDYVPAALRTGTRQGVRHATGDQALGQNAGAIVYGFAGLISPKSYMAPVQIAAKLVPVNKVALAAKAIEAVNLGKAANAESKVLQGLDLASEKPGLLATDFAKNARAYIRDMENRSGLPLGDLQKSELSKALKTREFERLDKTAKSIHGDQYTNSKKHQLIAEWEKNTRNSWPVYSEAVLKKNGEILFEAGTKVQAHHIIHQSHGGPHEWWNMMPLHTIEHQSGVHKAGAPGQIIHSKK